MYVLIVVERIIAWSRLSSVVNHLISPSFVYVEVQLMPNVTVISFLFSLLSYGLGFSKVLVLKKAVAEHINTYDYNTQVSLAMGYFILAIFFAVIGFFFLR